jgi:redox-sensing transcriptional repressor
VVGIVDIDPDKIGTVLGGVRVRHADELRQIVQSKQVNIGVITTPAVAAQGAAELLVEAGVTSILNFAPVVLNVPRSVEVRKVDLSVELQILSYHEQRRHDQRRPSAPTLRSVPSAAAPRTASA